MRQFLSGLPTRVTRYFSLIIGLACALAVLVYAFERLDSERHIENRKNIALITMQTHSGKISRVQHVAYAWAQASEFRIDDVLKAGRILPYPRTIRIEQKSEDMMVSFADENLFSILPFFELNGAQFSGFSALRGSAVTEDFALKWFGTSEVIGKKIRVNLQSEPTDYVIEAVLENLPESSNLSEHQLFLPMNPDDFPASVFVYKVLNSTQHQTYLKLRPDTNLYNLADELDKIGRALHDRAAIKENRPFSHPDDHIIPVTLDRVFRSHLKSPISGFHAPEPYRFIAIVLLGFLVLFLAILNAAMITLVDLERRYGSLATRRLVGGSAIQVIWPDLRQIGINVVISFVLAIALLPIVQRLLLGVETDIIGSPDLLLVPTFYILSVVGVISVALPVLFIYAVNPAHMLSGIRRRSKATQVLRLGGVFFQVCATTALITLVIVMGWQMQFLKNRDLGYDMAGLYTVDAPGNEDRWREKFSNALYQNIPGVEIASADTMGAFKWPPGLPYQYTKEKSFDTIRIQQTGVSKNFFEVMGARLLAGQWLSNETRLDGSATPVVINMTLVKALGWNRPDEAIGQIIRRDPYFPEYEELFPRRREVIIGVVRDLALQDPKRNQFSFSYTASNDAMTSFIRLPNSGLAPEARQILLNATTKPVEFTRLSMTYETINRQQAENALQVKRLTYICVALAFIGVSGLIAQSVVSRQSSFALRYILGAAWWNQIGMLARDVLPVSIVAIVLGGAAGLIMAQRWLTVYVLRITDINMAAIIAAGLIMLLIISAGLGPLTSLSPKRILTYLQRG